MPKSHLKLVTPYAVNRTVTPKRRPNAELRTREHLTASEVECLMAAAKANRWGHRDATMILVAYRHGLRVSELVDLRWDQVDFATATLHVRRVKQGTPSTHPINGDELRALRRMHREQDPKAPFVFTSERGAPFATAGFARMVERAGVGAKLPFKAHPHMLRHACGYKDTRDTKRWRREMQSLNAWLTAAPITILGKGDRCAVRVDKNGQPIEPYRRTLRRVFNNKDWNSGGRLYDGFWMTMERTERFRTIKIDGEEIANVDYSSLFPRLAYARAQAEQPDGDLYDVTGDGTCRDGWKVLISAMLFARKPLGGWPTDARQEFPSGTKMRDAIGAIKCKHAPIAKLFERGLGFRLMRHESDLLVSVVTALFKNGITALPLHDSVLVARSHAATAKAFMEQEFAHRSGSPRAFVKVDFGPN